MSTGLPRGVSLACWLGVCLRGEVSPDVYAAAVTADDPRHLVVGLAEEPLSLVEALGPIRRTARGVLGAVAAPGDPVGLAGPPDFNTAVLEAGSAVILPGTGRGLVPTEDARTVVWLALPAEVPPPLDVAEADRMLRRTLTHTATRLAELEVATWRPEIPDLLLNVHLRAPLPLPPSYDDRRAVIERAVLCLDIVAHAPHHEALADLGRAARRALVAACSDSLGPS